MKKMIFGVIAMVLCSNSTYSQDFDSYGLEHNKILNDILSNLPKRLTNGEIVSEMKIAIYKTVPKEIADKAYGTSAANTFEHHYANKLISEELFNLVKMSELKFNNTNNYSDILRVINELKNSSNSLNPNEKNLFYSYLSIFKHSFWFWDNIKTNDPNVSERYKICYKCIAKADARAAFLGPFGSALISTEVAAAEYLAYQDSLYIPIPPN